MLNDFLEKFQVILRFKIYNTINLRFQVSRNMIFVCLLYYKMKYDILRYINIIKFFIQSSLLLSFIGRLRSMFLVLL